MKNASPTVNLGVRSLFALVLALAAQQAGAQAELPLSGPAYRLADQAYRAYASGDYETAVSKSREGVRLRPDSQPLRALLAKSLAAQTAPAAAARSRPRRSNNQTAATRPNSEVRMPAAEGAAALSEDPVPAAANPGFESATAAYQAYAIRDYAQAATDAKRAVELSPDNRDYARLLVTTEVKLLTAQGRKPEARLRFDEALASGSLSEAPAVDTAYLAASVGNDPAALAAFQRADTTGQLPDTAVQDAGFAALRVQRDTEAIAYFKRSIDANRALKLTLSPKLLFDTRRTIAEVSRHTGVIASLTYRDAALGSGQIPGANRDSLQAGVEAYWRPWGYQNGRYVEVFARGFGTLYSQGRNTTGIDSLQTAVGARYKPLRDINLIGSLSRVISPRGGRNDWLAQLGYSGGSGTDLKVDMPSWSTARVSAEVGRYLSDADSYALAAAEFGPSVRLGDSEGRWVLFPHVSLAADYDSTAIEQGSSGMGGGLSARYWFREDPYNAPRSYWDATVQYRFGVEGAKRAEGIFATSTLSY